MNVIAAMTLTRRMFVTCPVDEEKAHGHATHAARLPAQIVMLIYPDAHLLDISGPMSLFAAANDFAGFKAYEVSLAALAAGPGRTRRPACRCWRHAPDRRAFICRGRHLAGRGRHRRRCHALQERKADGLAAAGRRRIAGAWPRSAAAPCCWRKPGLLDGRRAVTHWVRCDHLARDYPQCHRGARTPSSSATANSIPLPGSARAWIWRWRSLRKIWGLPSSRDLRPRIRPLYAAGAVARRSSARP